MDESRLRCGMSTRDISRMSPAARRRVAWHLSKGIERLMSCDLAYLLLVCLWNGSSFPKPTVSRTDGSEGPKRLMRPCSTCTLPKPCWAASVCPNRADQLLICFRPGAWGDCGEIWRRSCRRPFPSEWWWAKSAWWELDGCRRWFDGDASEWSWR